MVTPPSLVSEWLHRGTDGGGLSATLLTQRQLEQLGQVQCLRRDDAAELSLTRHGVCDQSLRQLTATEGSDAPQRAVSGIERRTLDDTTVVTD